MPKQNWKQPLSPEGHSTKNQGHSTKKPFPGVYRRSKTDKHSGEKIPHGKWLPRMKPPREQLSSGEKLIHEHLPLGGYDTPQDAKTVWDIAAFYYGKAEGELALPNGQVFSIPSMSEQEKPFEGKEKRQWVCRKAREVFEDFQKALKAATSTPNGALVSSEAATTVVASSPEILGSLQMASPSPEDFTLNPIFEDLPFDIGGDFDISGIPPALAQLFSLPTLSWDEGDAVGSTSEETASMEVDHLQQQPCESQDLQLQRQLGEARMQILELQREMKCIKSELRDRCFSFAGAIFDT